MTTDPVGLLPFDCMSVPDRRVRSQRWCPVVSQWPADEELERAGEPLELVGPMGAELEARTADEVDDRPGDHHLVGPRQRRDPAAMCTAMPPMSVAAHLDLADVHARPGPAARAPSTPSQMAAAHWTARLGPSKVASTPSPVVFTCSPRWRSQRSVDQGLVPVEQLPPGGVAEAGRVGGGVDEVGEEHGGELAGRPAPARAAR